MPLSDSNREALIIRLRRLLILGIVDFFNGSNDFGKLIVKELLDMYEGTIKAFAEKVGVHLFSENREWRSFKKIVEDIIGSQNVKVEVKKKLMDVNATVYSNEFNSLRKLRNDETHYLNLPDIPKETVIRVWRLIYEAIKVVDIKLFNYAKDRPEFEDFFFLQDFFKMVVLEGNREHIDLDRLKKKRRTYTYVQIERKSRTAEIEIEKDIFELIDSIKKGEYLRFH